MLACPGTYSSACRARAAPEAEDAFLRAGTGDTPGVLAFLATPRDVCVVAQALAYAVGARDRPTVAAVVDWALGRPAAELRALRRRFAQNDRDLPAPPELRAELARAGLGCGGPVAPSPAEAEARLEQCFAGAAPAYMQASWQDGPMAAAVGRASGAFARLFAEAAADARLPEAGPGAEEQSRRVNARLFVRRAAVWACQAGDLALARRCCAELGGPAALGLLPGGGARPGIKESPGGDCLRALAGRPSGAGLEARRALIAELVAELGPWPKLALALVAEAAEAGECAMAQQLYAAYVGKPPAPELYAVLLGRSARVLPFVEWLAARYRARAPAAEEALGQARRAAAAAAAPGDLGAFRRAAAAGDPAGGAANFSAPSPLERFCAAARALPGQAAFACALLELEPADCAARDGCSVSEVWWAGYGPGTLLGARAFGVAEPPLRQRLFSLIARLCAGYGRRELALRAFEAGAVDFVEALGPSGLPHLASAFHAALLAPGPAALEFCARAFPRLQRSQSLAAGLTEARVRPEALVAFAGLPERLPAWGAENAAFVHHTLLGGFDLACRVAPAWDAAQARWPDPDHYARRAGFLAGLVRAGLPPAIGRGRAAERRAELLARLARAEQAAGPNLRAAWVASVVRGAVLRGLRRAAGAAAAPGRGRKRGRRA